MNIPDRGAGDLAKNLLETCKNPRGDVMIAPPYPFLSEVREIINDSSISLGAQDLSDEKKGAYTGQISAEMLKSSGVRFVIIGHSERRSWCHEDDRTIHKKITQALAHGLTPILCVGESNHHREEHRHLKYVESQIRGGFEGRTEDDLLEVVVAYEPVWAIGTGKAASPEEANKMHAFIRDILASLHSRTVAQQVRILYGGSVNETNIDHFMAQADIDGALVGGSSLDKETFSRIIEYQN